MYQDAQRFGRFYVTECIYGLLPTASNGTGIFAYIYHRFVPNVGQYPIHGSHGVMGPRFRLAGDTHLIAWPDISLLGETLRLKDTEYSEVESSETEKRDGEMKLLTR